MPSVGQDVGSMVRTWRQRRRRSQLDVALAADVSTRHLSFIETGRAKPSRAMIERLCDELDVPLRWRNVLYHAAGFAPVHGERPFEQLGAAGAAVQALLEGHEPYPSVVVNARWDLLEGNRAMMQFLADIPAELAGPPVNMMRVALHPNGMAGRLTNFPQWRAQMLRRVRRQLERTSDSALAALLTELESYPGPRAGPNGAPVEGDDPADLATPMRLATEGGELSFLYSVTVFGSPRDITLDDIAIETFFPADDATRVALQELSRRSRGIRS